jgi:hypothetical protein
MYPKATDYPGGRDRPDQTFVVNNIFPVPGAGGAGKAKPQPFFFPFGKPEKKIPGVAMGIGKHKTCFLPK